MRPRYRTEKLGQRVGTMRPDAKPMPAEPLRDGQERCASCGRAVTLNTSGRLRKHRDRHGSDCWCRDYEGSGPVLEELPSVHIPETGRPPSGRPADRRSRYGSVTGSCNDCGKQVMPGRILCGQCAVRRSSR